ncbi:hypothetical protein [Streptomyces sp. AD55]|uniref:hypothetical protein n=1 Tax=Streptomyces sp. AD55 TaxID=3242895 RepID=UPI0035296F87
MSAEPEPTDLPLADDPIQSEPLPPEEEESPPAQPAPEPAQPGEEQPLPPAPEPPPAPDLPTNPLVFEPATFYAIENVCLTQDMGGGQPCPHLNKVYTEPLVYSNAGQPVIQCWPCGKRRVFLSATKLDPQPELS